jgi:hypothetical protein
MLGRHGDHQPADLAPFYGLQVLGQVFMVVAWGVDALGPSLRL